MSFWIFFNFLQIAVNKYLHTVSSPWLSSKRKEFQFQTLHQQYKHKPNLVHMCQISFHIIQKCQSATTKWRLNDLQTTCRNDNIAWINSYCCCSWAAKLLILNLCTYIYVYICTCVCIHACLHACVHMFL